MSEEPGQRERLKTAAQRAIDKQPDEIRLVAAPGHTWSNRGVIESHAEALRALGFADAATYTVDAFSGAVRFFLKSEERIYSTVYTGGTRG